LVAELATAGLVVRTRDEDDGRGISVSITDSGLELFKAAQETHLQDLNDRLFSRLSEREIADLGRITAKVLDPDRGSSPDGH
jgi:DNA-binding MarR family transcriptional regulator